MCDQSGVGNTLLYGFVGSKPTRLVDPSGFAPAVCQCRPGQRDAASIINSHVQSIIDQLTSGFGPTHDTIDMGSYGTIEAGIHDQLVVGGIKITGIEKWLSDQIDRASVDAEKCKCPSVKVPFQGDVALDSAPAIVVCGQCIGTDKLGHFFEEGLIYHHIAQQYNEDFAIAWGYWTEGMMPPNLTPAIWEWLVTGTFAYYGEGGGAVRPNKPMWGYFSDDFLHQPLDPNGTASPADLEANEGGMAFWNDLHSTPIGSFNFDICKYMRNGVWDQNILENIPGAPRGSPLPPSPAF